MIVSHRKIRNLIESYLDANGWEWSRTWESDGGPVVLTEYWTVQSRWSPTQCKFYIGFENWDAFDSLCLSSTEPTIREKNDWDESVMIRTSWREDLDELLQYAERMREEFRARQLERINDGDSK